MMLKATQLRQVLINSVPLLQQNPDNLTIDIQSGSLVSTLASSLSFEYHFQLAVVITQYADDIDLIMVPVLAWLRENQPDIMVSEEKRRTGFTFTLDATGEGKHTVTVTLQLTERVWVEQQEGGLHITHLPEPALPENDARPWQLYIKGKLVSEWKA
ncbi:phage tail protein [Pantoea sp. BS_4]|uniref:phage tail protein n=1 Tax=Pantoea TaxID=53335 RepID=UPI0009B8F939|nr:MULTISPECIES: phage tail protein [Pantoea]MDF7786535.1 phage tail protein [Pantoea stewartii]MDK2633493.1 phage tail protein [Pantoea stewartii subsp. indologenes]MEB6536137.1 phage tail protein [Pantoea stewartii]UYK97167.1 phage tail protein [Pantoea stewartii]WRH11724.1 phage tail protein [Pantoea sp. JZ2]